MGNRAAIQLCTTDPHHLQEIPVGALSGAVVGDIGEGSRAIPGRDDGTVGVNEAVFDGVADAITLPFGHTSIAVREAAIRQVLHFLRHGAFDHAG